MKESFNYQLSRARRVVENAFGVLSSVFHVLRKPMLLEPEKVKKVVLATIHLHNYLRKKSISSQQLYNPHESFDSDVGEHLFHPRGETVQSCLHCYQFVLWRKGQDNMPRIYVTILLDIL